MQPTTADELNNLLLNALVSSNWTFLQFDDSKFQQLIMRGFPTLKCPSRKSMKRYLTQAADKAWAKLKERLEANDSKISLTLDLWTSSNRLNFMGISLSQAYHLYS